MFKLEFDLKLIPLRANEVTRKQLPFAMALTLTRTAMVMANELNTETNFAFDRPVKLTQEAVRFRKATKTKLVAEIYVRDEAVKGTPPIKYLAPEVYGGQRRLKRFERALRAAGVLGPRELTVFARGAKLNQYGNVSSGTITSILSFLRANPDANQDTSTNRGSTRRRRYAGSAKLKERKQFFVPKAGGKLPLGIYERTGRGKRDVRGVFMFVEEADVSYEKRFKFFDIIQSIIARGELKKQWKIALRDAIRTAKK